LLHSGLSGTIRVFDTTIPDDFASHTPHTYIYGFHVAMKQAILVACDLALCGQ